MGRGGDTGAMGIVRFADFTLDTDERRLLRGTAPLEVSGRYFDALALMAAHPGQLITKDRFLDEVWRGVPVTDEALTQAMRALRKALGDDAANPRFIETVPKHGYRFVAPVETGTAAPIAARPETGVPSILPAIAAGTLGGGLAGLVGGAAYGLLFASAGTGGFSLLLVMAMLCMLVALLGALGVSAGIALAGARDGGWGLVLGGAAGGALVGLLGKLLSLDAFHLVVGQSPGDVTGGREGLLLGAAVGLGAMLAARRRARVGLRQSVVPAAGIGALAGGLIPLAGGKLMAGSLALMARSIPGSQLHVGGLFGEARLDRWSEALLGAGEGALFAALLVGGIELAARARDPA